MIAVAPLLGSVLVGVATHAWITMTMAGRPADSAMDIGLTYLLLLPYWAVCFAVVLLVGVASIWRHPRVATGIAVLVSLIIGGAAVLGIGVVVHSILTGGVGAVVDLLLAAAVLVSCALMIGTVAFAWIQPRNT